MPAALSAGVIPAAGSGQRLGAKKPKSLVKVGRRTLLNRAATNLSKVVDEIVVAAPPGFETEVAKSLSKLSVPVTVVAGGASRTESVALALAQVTPEVRYILIHDAARAFAPVALMRRVLNALKDGVEAVVPALAVSDTIKIVDENEKVESTLPRALLRAVQTPQGFSRELIERAHRAAAERGLEGTDDASLVEAIGVRVLVIPGDERAHKITTASDLERHRKKKRKGAKS